MPKTFTEGRHACEFILSEADGHLSRENVIVGENQTVLVGTILSLGGGGYDAIAAGGGAGSGLAIAMYAVTTAAGETKSISAIARDAEVNGHCLEWPAGATHDQMTAIGALLAAQHIIVRGYPWENVNSPTPSP